MYQGQGRKAGGGRAVNFDDSPSGSDGERPPLLSASKRRLSFPTVSKQRDVPWLNDTYLVSYLVPSLGEDGFLADDGGVDARRVVEGILRARPSARARDLNESFTNKALASGVSALATIAHGLEMFNDEADLPANRSGALENLQEGMDDIKEALAGRHGQTSGRWWIDNSGAGHALRANLERIVSATEEARLRVLDYISKHPILLIHQPSGFEHQRMV